MKNSLFFYLSIFFCSFSTSQCSSGATDNPDPDPDLDVKIGQMLKVGFRGLHLEDNDHIQRDIQDYHLGAVVLFDYDVPNRQPIRNVESPDQLRKLIHDLKELAHLPLLITIDQEGGRVARLKPESGFPTSVSAKYLGNIDNADTTYYYSELTAKTLKDLGINVNLAPVADVNLNPDNPIIGGIERSFSNDPDIVTRHARTFIKAHNRQGILTTLKHFPGHGSSKDDSHLGMVDVTNLWSDSELIPYRRLIQSGDVDFIMTAHIFNENWDDTYPATLSKSVMTGLLREELGFEGVIFSDDMQMDAVRSYYGLETAIEQTIKAGVDILGFANNSVYDPEIIPQAHQIIKQLIEDGRITEKRIDESYRRIQEMKKRLKEMNR